MLSGWATYDFEPDGFTGLAPGLADWPGLPRLVVVLLTGG